MTDTSIANELLVEGCFNIRDAGGWSTVDGRCVRTGLLFRADEPTRMTPAGRAVIDELELRAVIDLRGRDELGHTPGFGAAEITHHLPVVDKVIHTRTPRRIDGPDDIARIYDEMLELRRGQFIRAIELVAEHTAGGRVLVHCKAGKDRTGMLIALIHAALGVPRESIVEDYARSDAATRLRRAVMATNPMPGDPDLTLSPDLIWTAPAQAMEQFVDAAVDRHGSLEDWVLGIGVPHDAVIALRVNLLAD